MAQRHEEKPPSPLKKIDIGEPSTYEAIVREGRGRVAKLERGEALIYRDEAGTLRFHFEYFGEASEGILVERLQGSTGSCAVRSYLFDAREGAMVPEDYWVAPSFSGDPRSLLMFPPSPQQTPSSGWTHYPHTSVPSPSPPPLPFSP